MEFLMKIILTTAFLTTVISSNLYAADLTPPTFSAPPSPPSSTENPPELVWDGPYLGALGGYGVSKLTIETWCEDWLSESFPGGHLGAFGGYNWSIADGFIAGIEGDIGYDWNGKAFNEAKESGTGLTASARARVGHEVREGLLYVAGGWTGTNVYSTEPNDERFANGWTLGAGIDWRISEKAFLRAEYRFNKFEAVELNGIETQFDQSVVNVGLAVAF